MNTAIEYLCQVDKNLKHVILKTDSGLAIDTSDNIFEDLVSCILHMQIRYRGMQCATKD